jgi:hypothetical protein
MSKDPPILIPLYHWGKGKSNERMVYDKNGICPCLTSAMGMGGGYVPCIEIKQNEIKPKEHEKNKSRLGL